MNGTRATLAVVRRQCGQPHAMSLLGLLMALGLVAGMRLPLAYYVLVACGGAAVYLRPTDLTYFVAPLYGRQTARAHALSAAAFASLPMLAYLAGVAAAGGGFALGTATAGLAGAVVAALVGLSAHFRAGLARAGYYLAAACAGLSIVGVAAAGFGAAAALAYAVVLGFAALRAFGETLARYDPLPDF